MDNSNQQTQSAVPVVIEAVRSYPQFNFAELNPRRRARGKEAARMMVRYSSDPDAYEMLWMSRKDLRKNIMEFGEDPELVKALEAYGP